MLMLQYHTIHLLTTHHALRELRTVLEGAKNQSWIRTRYHGTSIVSVWGRDSVKNAQAVLVIVLSNRDDKLLSACPDSIFSMITFAAAWLIITNFSMYQLNCAPLGVACDKLITATMELLSRLALGPEHVLAKYSHVIATLMEVWDRRKSDPPKFEPPVNADSAAAAAATSTTGEPQTNEDPAETADVVPDDPAYQSEFSAWGASNTDVFMDPSFWASFMDNLASNTAEWSSVPTASADL